mgnify:CR=1 FL=1
MPPRTVTPRTAAVTANGGKGPRSDFVRPKTAQQAVAEALRRDITSGKLAPGSWIVQESLAEQFGMSRIPIREALKTLEAEEYITYVPHSGYRVAKLGLEPGTLTLDELNRMLKADYESSAVLLKASGARIE